jgi:acetoin utilization deacetylase AcuC-like enzyme
LRNFPSRFRCSAGRCSRCFLGDSDLETVVQVLPALVHFNPDLILVSAGFDAHKKDTINFHYIGIQEKDFEWLTDQIVQVANRLVFSGPV